MLKRLRARSFHLGILPLLAGLHLVPRRYRWRALIALEALVRPIARALVPEPGFHPNLIVEEDRRLYRLIERATRAGLRFDPLLEHRGIEHFDALLAGNSGYLGVGMHAELLYLVERHLYDIGRKPAVISMNLGINILGTNELSDILERSNYTLLRVRREIGGGKPVFAMIDFDDHLNVVPVRIGDEVLELKTPLLTLARSLGAPILFFHATRSGQAVRLIWGAPVAADTTGEEVAAEFGEFLRRNLLPGAA